jgi:hypothetical protein
MGASERDEWSRAAWRALIGREVDARRLVFVDECGTHTSLAPLYAWARLGERAHAQAPRNRGKNTTLLASMTAEGMGPCMAVVGSTTTAVFEAYVEQVLAPALRPGQIVVMDNLAAHKGERVRELVEGSGCGLSYLPPYSSGPQPHRGGVLEGQDLPAARRGSNTRGAGGGYGASARRGDAPGRTRLLQTLRLRPSGSISMTDAVG